MIRRKEELRIDEWSFRYCRDAMLCVLLVTSRQSLVRSPKSGGQILAPDFSPLG